MKCRNNKVKLCKVQKVVPGEKGETYIQRTGSHREKEEGQRSAKFYHKNVQLGVTGKAMSRQPVRA